MRLKLVATFGLGDLVGECLDRWGATDEHVAQRFGARIGIVESVHSVGDVLRVLGHGMDDSHRLLAT